MALLLDREVVTSRRVADLYSQVAARSHVRLSFVSVPARAPDQSMLSTPRESKGRGDRSGNEAWRAGIVRASSCVTKIFHEEKASIYLLAYCVTVFNLT